MLKSNLIPYLWHMPILATVTDEGKPDEQT